MTVVTYIKLGGRSAIGCADENVTYGVRTYPTAEKIEILTPYSFIAFGGAVTYGNEIINCAKDSIRGKQPIKTIAEMVAGNYKTVRDAAFERGVLHQYNITWKDLKEGKIDRKLKDELLRILSDPSKFGVDMMLCGYDADRGQTELYSISYPGQSQQIPKYAIIGSGADRASLVVGDHLSRLNSERNDIPLPLGCRIILEATQSAWGNIGVGGKSQLVYINNGSDVQVIDKRTTTLLHAILFLEQKMVVPKVFVDEMFEKMTTGNVDLEWALSKIKAQVSADELYDMFFLESLHM